MEPTTKQSPPDRVRAGSPHIQRAILDRGLFPSVVTATFNFIEPKQLKALVRGIYEHCWDYVKVTEHRGPGDNSVVFEGQPANYLIELMEA